MQVNTAFPIVARQTASCCAGKQPTVAQQCLCQSRVTVVEKVEMVCIRVCACVSGGVYVIRGGGGGTPNSELHGSLGGNGRRRRGRWKKRKSIGGRCGREGALRFASPVARQR